MAEHYFQDNELQAEGLANLRLCQAEALQALKDFVPHDEDGARKRGLVVLPTGTGKSTLMLATPYALGVQGRVVILTPRPNVSTAVLKSKQNLLNFKLLSRSQQPPEVLEIVRRTQEVSESATNLNDRRRSEKVRNANFIVANIHKLLQDDVREILTELRPNGIGALLIDEAHHVLAQSWQAVQTYLEDTFPNLRVIYLTATPFRSCKEEVLTDVCTMVYSYPLAEAIKQGWLKNISFHEVFVEKAHFYRTNVDGEVSPRSTQSSSSSMSSSTPGRAGKQYPEHYYLGTEELDAQRSRPHIYSECKYDPAVRTQVLEEAVRVLSQKRLSGTGFAHKMIVKMPSGRVNNKQFLADVADELAHLGDRLSPFREHGGFRADFLFSNTKNEDLKMELFESTDPRKELHALVVVDKLKEGYDFHLVSCVAFLDPMGPAGLGNFTQILGRMLRAIPGGSQEDNKGVVVGHQLHDLYQFWLKYCAEEHSETAIKRLGKLVEFKDVKPDPDGYEPSPERVRVFHLVSDADVRPTPPPASPLRPRESIPRRDNGRLGGALCIGVAQDSSELSPLDVDNELVLRTRSEEAGEEGGAHGLPEVLLVQRALTALGMDVAVISVVEGSWLTKQHALNTIKVLLGNESLDLKVLYLVGHGGKRTGDLLFRRVDDRRRVKPADFVTFEEVCEIWRSSRQDSDRLVVVADIGSSEVWVDKLMNQPDGASLRMSVQSVSRAGGLSSIWRNMSPLYADGSIGGVSRVLFTNNGDDEEAPPFHSSWGAAALHECFT